ncbi:hypothetical protein [Methylovulum miyakonense]|uniref:hypothetical protein n=1 Tax=Methylovulum miyakonense TaxID=645578 RepID=UPI000A052704|nr:hypothetical protein [Methylovulum miyakonense]
MQDIRERMIILLDFIGLKNPKLEEKTGIPRTTWGNIRNRRGRANEEQITAVIQLWPEYAYWLTTGLTIPEAGQISPDMEDTRQRLNLRTGTD